MHVFDFRHKSLFCAENQASSTSEQARGQLFQVNYSKVFAQLIFDTKLTFVSKIKSLNTRLQKPTCQYILIFKTRTAQIPIFLLGESGRGINQGSPPDPISSGVVLCLQIYSQITIRNYVFIRMFKPTKKNISWEKCKVIFLKAHKFFK